MDDDYFSIPSILADNHVSVIHLHRDKFNGIRFCSLVADANGQKLSCTFTLDIPGLGYLEGSTEPDVSPLRWYND
jgi:hypothetical protein